MKEVVSSEEEVQNSSRETLEQQLQDLLSQLTVPTGFVSSSVSFLQAS